MFNCDMPGCWQSFEKKEEFLAHEHIVVKPLPKKEEKQNEYPMNGTCC